MAVDVLGDKSWDKALDDFRDFLDLVERDLNDLLDVPDLRELDDLLDLLEDWERKLGAPRELTPGVADQGVHDDEGRASVSRHNMTGSGGGQANLSHFCSSQLALETAEKLVRRRKGQCTKSTCTSSLLGQL